MTMEINSGKASTSGLQNNGNIRKPKSATGADPQAKQESSKYRKILQQKISASNGISGADIARNDKLDDQNVSADNAQKKENDQNLSPDNVQKKEDGKGSSADNEQQKENDQKSSSDNVQKKEDGQNSSAENAQKIDDDQNSSAYNTQKKDDGQKLSADSVEQKEDGQNSSSDNLQKKEERKIKSIKSLADLIGFCRDSGIQVYNDTPNVPEADRILMESLGEQDNLKKHSSDDKEANRRKRSKQNKSGKTSLKFDIDGETRVTNSAATRPDVTSRKTSAVLSESNRSRATSRISSVYSSTENEGKTKDAEELLQLRMRNRSKRRRENQGTLVGLINEARKLKNESEMKLTEETDKSENLDTIEGIPNDRPKSVLTSNDKPGPDINKTEEQESPTEPENVQSNDTMAETNGNEGSKQIKTEVKEDLKFSMNESKNFKDKSEEEIDENGNQELTSSDTTINADKERSLELEQNSKQETGEEEKEREEAKEEDKKEIEDIHVIPDRDEGNETNKQPEVVISGRASITETKHEDGNMAQETDTTNSSLKDRVHSGDLTNRDLDQTTTSNDERDENLQSNDTEVIKNNNESDGTNTITTIEDDSQGHEITRPKKTDDKDVLVNEDDHDRSNNIDFESQENTNEDKHDIGHHNRAITKHEKRDTDENDTHTDIREDKVDVSEESSANTGIRDSTTAFTDIADNATAHADIGDNTTTHTDIVDNTTANADIGDNASVHTDIGGDNQLETNFTQERSDSEILKNVADVNKPKEEQLQLENESEKTVEEVRIKDGKSTLVLYKVKEKSLMNMEQKNNADIEIKRVVADNDIHTIVEAQPDTDMKVKKRGAKNEDNQEHNALNNEGPGEANNDTPKYEQNGTIISATSKLSQNIISVPTVSTDSQNEDYNSETSMETNDTSDASEISEKDSEINTSNHDGDINIDHHSSENKDIEKKSLSRNSSDRDQMNDEILNSDKIHEKSISDYKIDGEINLSITENITGKEMQNQTVDNEIKSKDEQGLNEDSNLEENNVIHNDQGKKDDMSEITDEHGKHQENGARRYSEDEGNELGYVGKGKGKMETKVESDTEKPEQPSRRNSKKGMTAEEWMNFLHEMNRKKTNIESSRMLSSQARVILLLEKAKQTNEYYGKEHVKTIKLFEEARGVFSDLDFLRGKGRGFRPRENSEETTEIKEEEQTESQTETQDQEQAEENVEKQEQPEEPTKITEEKGETESEATAKKKAKEVKPKKKKVKMAAPALPKLSDERLRQIREMYWNNGETFELDGEEYFLDPNGELVRSIKFNASKKIDTRWDPGHPMFKKLQNKNKVPAEIKDVAQAAKSTKPSKLKANDISASNVYVTEAKRIFPKGFEEDKNSKTEVKKVKKLKSFKMKSVDIGNTGQEENTALTRIESIAVDIPEKKKLNRNVSVPDRLGADDTHPLEETAVEVNKRKLRKAKSVSSKIADSKTESINENDGTGAGKRLKAKTTKHNNYVEPEKNHVTDTTGDTSKENKTVTDKKKKKIKYKKTNSNKEFEVDQAFLIDQKEFNEKTVNLDGVKITSQTNEVFIKKRHSKTQPKDRLPNLEFQTQDEESSKNSTQNDHQDEDKIISPTENDRLIDETTASRKRTFKRKSKKKRKASSDELNALKIFQEARDDLPRDLSIVNDTKEGYSKKLQKTKKKQVEYSSTSSLVSGKSDMSMQTAVEIMQSRGRFYVNPDENTEKKEPREHRVYRLYREIQTIRRNTEPAPKPSTSLVDASRSVLSDPDTGFLLLNYERRNKCFRGKSWRTYNSDVKKFLYGNIDYEVCSKVKGVNSTFRRRLKAYDFLKMKMSAR